MELLKPSGISSAVIQEDQLLFVAVATQCRNGVYCNNLRQNLCLGQLIVIAGIYVAFVGPVADEIGSSLWQTAWIVVTMLGGILGAYICCRRHGVRI